MWRLDSTWTPHAIGSTRALRRGCHPFVWTSEDDNKLFLYIGGPHKGSSMGDVVCHSVGRLKNLSERYAEPEGPDPSETAVLYRSDPDSCSGFEDRLSGHRQYTTRRNIQADS